MYDVHSPCPLPVLTTTNYNYTTKITIRILPHTTQRKKNTTHHTWLRTCVPLEKPSPTTMTIILYRHYETYHQRSEITNFLIYTQYINIVAHTTDGYVIQQPRTVSALGSPKQGFPTHILISTCCSGQLGHTFCPTPICSLSDPSHKVLFARPLEYFKSINIAIPIQIIFFKNSWANFMRDNKNFQTK